MPVYATALVMLLGFLVPSTALAALAVTFEQAPLFVGANVMPGDAVTRTVTVTNTGAVPEAVVFKLDNTFSDGLAEVMELAVISGAAVYSDTTFGSLFGVAEIPLGTLPAGASKTYDFTSLLDPAVGNEYQLTTLGFDLLIGFSGGVLVPDTPSNGGGGGGGGGGNSSGSTVFDLFNEAVVVTDNSVATLTWNTNRSATSYAVCGNDNDGPFTLNPDDALFGYVFATTEDTAKISAHTAEFADLTTGRHSCRVASREDVQDDFTVSGELYFTILPPGEVLGIADGQPLTAGNVFQPIATVAGISTGGKGLHLSYEEYRAELDALKAAAEVRALDAAAAAESLDTTAADTSASPIDDIIARTTNTSWWWLMGLLLLGLGGRWWWVNRR